MSPEPKSGPSFAALLTGPQEARLAAYLALRPGKSIGLEGLSKIVDLRPDWISATLRSWAQSGLPLKANGDTWSWDDFGKAALDSDSALKQAVSDHKAKFEIQEILVFLESETVSRRSRG